MMKTIKHAALLLSLATSSLAQAGGHLMVNDAWIREAPPGAMALAGYLQIHNHENKERVLVGASSPAFAEVMLHKTVFEGELSKMVHQHMITIPAGGMVSFEPNSYHLMMMQPKQRLQAGDKVSVTLRFQNGEELEVSHQVRVGMGGMGGMDHGAHQHH